MRAPKNVDAILTQSTGLQPEPITLANDAPPPVDSEPTHQVAEKPVEKEVADTQTPVVDEKPPQSSSEDEYGTPVEVVPEKTYTESEVQAMMRARLARVKSGEAQPLVAGQPTQAPTTPESGWEAELESFIDNTLSKREQKIQQEQWQRQEMEAQSNFEIKFNQGAAQYKDFEQVVLHGATLTPDMVLATRNMANPAAFLYAAAKTQGEELARISKILDPYGKALELGKLEERMKRERSNVTKAPAPIDPIKGDLGERVPPKTKNIDDKILADQKRIKEERIKFYGR